MLFGLGFVFLTLQILCVLANAFKCMRGKTPFLRNPPELSSTWSPAELWLNSEAQASFQVLSTAPAWDHVVAPSCHLEPLLRQVLHQIFGGLLPQPLVKICSLFPHRRGPTGEVSMHSTPPPCWSLWLDYPDFMRGHRLVLPSDLASFPSSQLTYLCLLSSSAE